MSDRWIAEKPYIKANKHIFCHIEVYYSKSVDNEIMKKNFFQGEKLLNLLGKNIWSDYKILIFKKNESINN